MREEEMPIRKQHHETVQGIPKSQAFSLYTFQAIKDDTDEIIFLCAIKEFYFKFEAHENIHVSICNMNKRTVNANQNQLDPVKYIEKVKSQGSIITHTNTGIWYYPVTMEAELMYMTKKQ